VFLAIAWAAQLALAVPLEVLAAALVPALIWAAPLAFLGTRIGLGLPSIATAFLWGGAVAAPLAGELNDLGRGHIGAALGPEVAATAAPFLLAPLVEELLKAAILVPLLLRGEPAGGRVLAGIVYGALSGMGFSAAENTRYLLIAVLQGGLTAMLVGAWSRGVLAGAKHAVYAATAGAGIGWAMTRRRLPALGVAAGLAAAFLQHAAWNAMVAPRLHGVVCNAAEPGGPCRPGEDVAGLIVTAPALVAVALVPAALALVVLAVRVSRAAAEPADSTPG
jgi:RsiW-degrading membrane proteinase PrsW (M82 family)